MTQEARLYKQMLDRMDLADTKYWLENNPIISDDEYDALIQQIICFEETHPDLVDPSRSPSLNFNGSNSSGSVVHTARMYSLDKGYDRERIKKWYDKVTKVFPMASFYVDPKLDGLAIDVWYRNFKLYKILTRGTNGIAGEDITHQAPLFHTLPKLLPSYPFLKDIDIRGEAVLYDTTFRHHIQETYPNTYSNSRSAVGGLLNSKSLSAKSLRQLSFKAYGAIFHTPHPFQTHKEIQLFLRDVCRITVPAIGEIVPSDGKPVSFEEIWDRIQDIDAHRERIMCAADGVVVRLNTISDFEHFGYTDHHPIGAIAYKFAPKGANTILTKIVYQVTKTGKLSPVGIIEPIQVDGVTITNVNLHNESHIIKLGVELGDMVHVVRQGDSIPMIKSVIVERRALLHTKPHIPPTICISCQQPLVRPHNSDYMYCVNPNCPAIFLENIVYFTSKHGMNVKGIGASVWKQFIEAKRIRNYKDIFTLNITDFLYVVGEEAVGTDANIRYSEKTCTKFYHILQTAWRNLTLATCMVGLGIPRIGRGVSLHIGKLYKTHTDFLEALAEDKPKQLSALEWKALQDYFSNPDNIDLIRYIFDNQPK